jgi:hypothetical protein
MRKRFVAGAVTATMVAALFGASGASAATEFGSNCNAGTGGGGITAISLGHGPGSPLAVTAPVSGVITGWKLTTSIEIPPEAAYVFRQQLQLFRPTTGASQFLKVAESPVSQISTGFNSFQVRIPVQAGDWLGLNGTFFTFLCSTPDITDVTGIATTPGPLPVGAAATFPPATKLQVPVAAVIEPDADKDGYGDETQDGCPQSAAYQTACPVITINALSQAGSKAVTVFVATSLSAPVQISGSVKLGKGATANLKATTVGGVPGVIAKVQLQFPASLKKRLKELKPKQKLTLKVSASAANIAGPATTTSVSAKLKGQGS